MGLNMIAEQFGIIFSLPLYEPQASLDVSQGLSEAYPGPCPLDFNCEADLK